MGCWYSQHFSTLKTYKKKENALNLKRKSNKLSVMLILSGAMVLAAAGFVLSQASPVSGSSNFLTRVETLYPAIIGTRIDHCTICHVTTDPVVLNSYGLAYQAAGESAAALVTIQNLDSDGDGWTNLKEIQKLTFPGDKNDHPSGAVNGDPFQIFIPVTRK
jgi:hypothetical protein